MGVLRQAGVLCRRTRCDHPTRPLQLSSNIWKVPFIVIPEEYLAKHEAGLPGNNIAAVIWYFPFYVLKPYQADSSAMETCSTASSATQMVTAPRSQAKLHG